MAQTTVSVRMDNDLKKEFDSVCNDLGLSMTTAITATAIIAFSPEACWAWRTSAMPPRDRALPKAVI